uniref:Uncharacterized protein n=1 Tax=Minutocellus polymorphus TaxID=265543 RepID=A0A7S0AX19_9STRA|mmetsp:Transcript_6275/g.10477  ORF Transcript_6275/g.10477 Transcript_6275/m.10477 type:complete len:113 (+) Transcript_6275:56-394(+)
MKTFFHVTVTAVLIGLANAFIERTPASPRSTALGGGFLDGSGKKTDIMKREDDAMYVEDPSDKPSGGWNPFAIAKNLDDPKQVEARKARSKTPPPPPTEPKKSGGFKFPWDN